MSSLHDSKETTPDFLRHDPDEQSPNADLSQSHSNEDTNNDPLDLEKTTTNKTITGTRANIFMLFTVLTQLVQMVAFGAGINAGPIIAPQLGSPLSGSWIAASYPLTQGTFVLIGGTLGSIHGHKNILALGSGWWVFWTLATGISDDIVGFAFMRGLAGVGGGLMVPNAVALLGITFEPGKKRNLSMALFGAMAPVGAAGGSLVAGAFVQNTEWKWLFFFL
jgi:MFS family permease